MRGTNRKRTLLVSSAVILLCMTIIVGMTFALFTDTKTVKNHLQAGDLSITLTRTRLTKTTLDASGYLVTSDPDTTPLNFSQPTDENVFGITENEKIVPGTKFTAKMKIANNSDVAFGYWIEIVCTDQSRGEDLAKQLVITVDDSENSYLANGLKIGGPDAYIEVLEIGEDSEFVISVEFEDKGFRFENGVLTSGNDVAQGEDLTFDLIVYAVQIPTAPSTP